MLSAALFAVTVHTFLLGVAASLRVSPSHESRALVSITLIQQATPLSVAESGIATSHADPVPLSIPPMRKPPQRKHSTALKPPVTKAPSPAAKLARVKQSPAPLVSMESFPPPQQRAEVRQQEDDPRLAAIPPTVPPQGSEKFAQSFLDESSQASDLGTIEAQHNGAEGNATTVGAPENGSRGVGEGTGKGARGNGESVLAQPHYGVNPKPVYPLLARRMGAQGVVLLRVCVQPDGSVAAVELVHSSGFALLDEAATRTVSDNWRFFPARRDGVAIESWVEVPIKFVLAES
jgi:periplasmic protein TonB